MKKYYFMNISSYKLSLGKSNRHDYNVVTDIHPVIWLMDTRKEYGKDEQYDLLFFSEIDEKTFKKTDGWIG